MSQYQITVTFRLQTFFFFKVSWCIFLLIFSKLITYAQRVKSFYKLCCEKQVPLFLSFDLSNNFRSWLLAASFGTNTMFLNRLMLLFLILKIFLRHCLWLLLHSLFKRSNFCFSVRNNFLETCILLKAESGTHHQNFQLMK